MRMASRFPVTPFFNWVHVWTPAPHSVCCRWWRLAALLSYRNRGSGLDRTDQVIL